MSVTVEILGRTAQANENSSRTRKYFVRGAADEAAAIAAVAGFAPATVGGLVLRTIDVDEEIKDGYRCDASYGQFQRREPPQVGESQFNFEIATQQIKVLIPINPQTVYKRTDDVKSLPTIALIGDQGVPGQPAEGVEIFEPVHSESETHYLSATSITDSYKQQVKKLVGKVNNALWKGQEPGEALLSAVSGSRRGADDWEVTFRWSVRENETSISVDGFDPISKKGWQYLWPRYLMNLDDPSHSLTSKIEYLVVSDVFREGDFSLLGID